MPSVVGLTWDACPLKRSRWPATSVAEVKTQRNLHCCGPTTSVKKPRLSFMNSIWGKLLSGFVSFLLAWYEFVNGLRPVNSQWRVILIKGPLEIKTSRHESRESDFLEGQSNLQVYLLVRFLTPPVVADGEVWFFPSDSCSFRSRSVLELWRLETNTWDLTWTVDLDQLPVTILFGWYPGNPPYVVSLQERPSLILQGSDLELLKKSLRGAFLWGFWQGGRCCDFFWFLRSLSKKLTSPIVQWFSGLLKLWSSMILWACMTQVLSQCWNLCPWLSL